MALWGQGLAQQGQDKEHQVGDMMVQKEERVLGVVQSEAWRDTFRLVLVQKAQERVLHYSVGVQVALQVEHLDYSMGWSLASLAENGRLLYWSQQQAWQRIVQVAHLPTKIHPTFSRQDPRPRRSTVEAVSPVRLAMENR